MNTCKNGKGLKYLVVNTEARQKFCRMIVSVYAQMTCTPRVFSSIVALDDFYILKTKTCCKG